MCIPEGGTRPAHFSQIIYFYIHKNLEIHRIQLSSSSLPWAMENF